MTLLELMRTIALFEGLADDQLQRLLAISDENVYDAGTVLFRQGETGDRLYIIVDGQVEVRLRSHPDRPERTQVFLGRGQVVGEMALLDKGPRSATIRCSQDHTVLRSISHAACTELCNADAAIGYTIMRNLARDLSFKLRHANLTPGSR